MRIARGVLLPSVNPEGTHMVQSNEEFLAIAARYPERFVTFCNLDPRLLRSSPDLDLSYFLSYYKDHGAKGVGEVCCNLHFDDPFVLNLFKHCEACAMPVLF
jgi:predicted TIM-barrel fold metal-dependent hydrolase